MLSRNVHISVVQTPGEGAGEEGKDNVPSRGSR